MQQAFGSRMTSESGQLEHVVATSRMGRVATSHSRNRDWLSGSCLNNQRSLKIGYSQIYKNKNAEWHLFVNWHLETSSWCMRLHAPARPIAHNCVRTFLPQPLKKHHCFFAVPPMTPLGVEKEAVSPLSLSRIGRLRRNRPSQLRPLSSLLSPLGPRSFPGSCGSKFLLSISAWGPKATPSVAVTRSKSFAGSVIAA